MPVVQEGRRLKTGSDARPKSCLLTALVSTVRAQLYLFTNGFAGDANQKKLWKAKLWDQNWRSKLSVKPSRNIVASSSTVLSGFFRQPRRGNISALTRRLLACMV